MQPVKNHNIGAVDTINSPFGEFLEHPKAEQLMALLALSHTPIEHRLYLAMHSETIKAGKRGGAFSTRRLMFLTGLQGYSTVRRALSGLLNKHSIERQPAVNDEEMPSFGAFYFIFTPEEIFSRRRNCGLAPYPKEIQAYEQSAAFGLAIERVVDGHNLSRREAQVALCCAQGMTNAQIGKKLHVTEQTVKFHLRHIFVKFGVKRRTELVSRLLMQRS